MGNFNRGGGFSAGGRSAYSGGGNRGGGNRFGGGRDSGRPNFRREDRGPVEMFQAVCDECKKPCEVPFRPTAGKPVYCSDCFRAQQGGGQDRGPRRDFGDRPQAPRPSFSNNNGVSNGSNTGGSDIKKQLELLNSKMDKLISSLGNLTQGKSPVKTEVVKNVVAQAPKVVVVENKAVKNEVVKNPVVMPKKEVKNEVTKPVQKAGVVKSMIVSLPKKDAKKVMKKKAGKK